MAHKERFAKSILYSAIFASLYTVSGRSFASDCPVPDEGGNIHVSPGIYCSGGIQPEESVNNVAIEGLVDGDLVNNHGINDYWMNGGTLTGSYINNDSVNDVFITNGSEIFNDIRNHGQMDSVQINDGPGKETVIYGSLVNMGEIQEITLSGDYARIDGDILNATDGEIGFIGVHDGATVGGDVLSEGGSGYAIVVSDGATVEGNIETASDGFFGIGMFNDANIAGDVINSGDGFVMTNAGNSRIEGSMINRGSIGIMEVLDGAAVANDLVNEGDVHGQIEVYDDGVIEGSIRNSGFVADGIYVVNSRVGSSIINTGDIDDSVHVMGSEIGNDLINAGMIRDGISVVDGSRQDGNNIGGSLINDVDGISHGSIEVLDQVKIGGNIENRGEISFESDKASGYAEYLPRALTDIEPPLPEGDFPPEPAFYEADLGAIRVDHQTTVTGKVINSGSINIFAPEIEPPPEEPVPMLVEDGIYLPEVDREGDGYILGLKTLSGISVSNESTTGEILNTGTISVHTGLEDFDVPFWLFGDGVSVNGITVREGSEVAGITNQGSISADTFGILVEGKGREGSTKINGSILNAENATIESGFNGIFVSGAEVTGSVVNSGTITSKTKNHAPSANGIHIKDSLVGGDVKNDGKINAGVEGIEVDGSVIKGSVINEGEVIADSDSLYIQNAAVIENDVISSGSIRAIRHDGVDISDSTVNGSVILSGSIEAGDNVIEIDGGYLNGGDTDDDKPVPFVYSVIGGDLINSALLTNVLPEEFDEVNGGDGFDFDFVQIGGSLINSGDINVTKRGFDLEDVTIASNFENSGSIVAGREGIRVKFGGFDENLEPGPDDDRFETPVIGATEIKGNFVNAGDIKAGDTGILLEQVSIGGSFANIETIESAKASAIDIRASSIAGDFFNSGYLIANAGVFPAEGEYYREQWDDTPSEDGKVRLTSMGVDSNDDAWFRIRNESNEPYVVYLDEHGGDFVSDEISVAPGEIVYINTGDHNGGNEMHRLFNADGDTQLQVKASGKQEFSPQPVEATQRGISLTGNVYADDGELLVERPLEISGSVINTGSIDANDEGIYIENAVIGGDVTNSGRFDDGVLVDGTGIINAETTGIAINQAEIKGSIINGESGEINAGYSGIRITDVSGVENIINAGTISVGNADTEYMAGDGMLAMNVEMNGIVANTGTISAETLGVVLLGVDGATGFENTGEINAHYIGMLAVDSQINGNVINDTGGVINAVEDGMVLADVDGITNVANNGTINAENRSGIALYSSSVDEQVVNTGTINAGDDGIVIRHSQVTSVNNSGEINAGTRHDDGYTHGNGIAVYNASLDDGEALEVINTAEGSITAIDDAMELTYIDGNILVVNAGTINAEEDGVDFHRVDGDIVLQNLGTVTASDDAIELKYSTGNVSIQNNGQLLGEDNALNIDDVKDGDLTIANSGVISSGSSAISVDSDGDGEMSLINSGTIASSGAAAVEATGTMVGQITNYGILRGGIYQLPQEPELEGESGRGLDYSSAVAIDYRFSGSALNFANGQDGDNVGVIEGDIYGSSLDSDEIEFAAGQYSDNIYDVEDINITGLVGLTGGIFSFNNDSHLNVSDAGTLSLSSSDQVNLEGRYSQQGSMSLLINQDTASLVDPLLDITGEAELSDGAVLRVSLENQDISHINSDAGSQEVHLIHAGQGVVDNGLDVQSDSILFNYEKFERPSDAESSEEFGLIASINSLGDLATAGGADSNVANALNGLQGAGSAGLEVLQESNPELYNQIYNGTEESLAALGSGLLASPDSGIAASLGAQSEALNTILARIADLRSGATGISAGDEETSGKYRPDALWIRAIYSDGKQDAVSSSNGNFNAYTLRSTGFTMGVDKDFTDNLTLGAGFSHATSTVNEQALAQNAINTETSSYIGSLYASWRNQSYFVDATFNYGVSKNDLRGAGWTTEFDASQFGISLMAGKGFLFSDNDALLEPQVGFNYARLDSDPYSYNSGVNVNVGAQTLEAIELGAGLRFTRSFEVGNGVLLPEASLMMWHDFSADSVGAELEFETGGGSFTYFGPEGVKNRYQAGLGVEYLMDNNVTLTARYDRNWQTGFGADTWTAKVRYDF